jgi:hypothetical protein
VKIEDGKEVHNQNKNHILMDRSDPEPINFTFNQFGEEDEKVCKIIAPLPGHCSRSERMWRHIWKPVHCKIPRGRCYAERHQ